MISRAAERPQHPGTRHANHLDTVTTDPALLATPLGSADLRNARLGGEPGAACLPTSALGFDGNTRSYLVICCGSAVADNDETGLGHVPAASTPFPGRTLSGRT